MASTIIGHDEIIHALDRAVHEGRVHHAYLLCGPPRVGKTTVGRWLALRLNCTGSDPPCEQCPDCRAIRAGTYPDVRAIQLSTDRDPTLGLALDLPPRPQRAAERVIGIDQVRALQRDAALAPHRARWKVYLLPGAESLSLEAANCLLKTLEEPPPQVVLVLTAVDPGSLPATVVSRCQILRLAPVPAAAIAAALAARYNCPSDRAALLARLSGGRPGWAIDAAARDEPLAERAQDLADLNAALTDSLRARLALAERLATEFGRDPARVVRTLGTWQIYWWDVRLVQLGCSDLITNLDRQEELTSLAEQLAPSLVDRQVGSTATALQRLLQNVNPRLALEALLLATPTHR